MDATIEFWLDSENFSFTTVLSARSPADAETLRVSVFSGGDGSASVSGTWGSTFFNLESPVREIEGRHHVALVRDTVAGLLTVLVDGVKGESVTLTEGPLEIAADRLALGRRWAENGTFSELSRVRGLGELKIWRRARTEGEIAASYLTPQTLPAQGLAGYFRANEPDGAVLVNAAAPGVDGSLAAAPADPARRPDEFALPDVFARGPEDQPLSLVLSAADEDGDAVEFTLTDASSVTVFAAVSNGQGGFVPAAEPLNLPTTLTPTGGAARVFFLSSEPHTARLTYFASDAVSTSRPGVALAVFTDEPDSPSAPTGGDDFSFTLAGQPVRVSLLENDFDPDGTPREDLRYRNVTPPAHGTLEVPTDGFSPVSYTPAQDFSGDNTFTYQVTDGALTSGPVTVTIRVTASRVFRWIAADGGSWNDPARWDRGELPGRDDLAVIDLPGDYTVTVDQAVNIGRLRMSAATLDVLTALTISGSGEITDGGLARLDAPAANLSFQGTGSSVARAVVRRGTLTGNETRLTRSLAWKGGLLGGVVIDAACAVDLAAPVGGRSISGSLTNHSTLRFDAGSLIVGGLLLNAEGGEMELAGPASVSRNQLTFPVFRNEGTMRVGPSASFNMDNFNFFSFTGALELAGSMRAPSNSVVSGNLVMSGGTFSKAGNTPVLRIPPGTVVEGFGRIFANVENSGLIASDASRGGDFASHGGLFLNNLINTAEGTLRLSLGAPYIDPNDPEPNDPSDDHLAIETSTLTPGGRLEIELLPGFARTADETFGIIRYFARGDGDFAEADGLTANFGYDFTRGFTDASLDLTVAVAGTGPDPLRASPESAFGFGHWIARHAATVGASDLGLMDDADRDGAPNLLEYAFGTNPFDKASLQQPVPLLDSGPDGPRFILEYRRRVDTATLRYEVWESADLVHWSPVSAPRELSRTPVPGQPGIETVCVQIPSAAGSSGGGAAVFLLLRVTEVVASRRP